PNWKADTSPAYPFNDASKRIRLGTKDSHTDTGNGVSLLQRKLGLKVTGTMSAADVRAVRAAQKRAEITVDGRVGPQSWAAFFQVGANTGTLAGAFPMPLAIASKVQPYKYGPN